MSRIKLLLAGMLAIAAVSGIMSAAAQAAGKCEEVGIPTVCTATSETGALEELTTTEPDPKVTGTGGASELLVPALSITILSKKVKVAGELLQPEPLVVVPLLDKLVFTFEEVTIDSPPEPTCTVAATLVTNAVRADAEEEADPVKLISFEPEAAGGAFITIKISGASCTQKGSFEVKGVELAEVLEPGSDKKVHTLDNTSTGTLTFGGHPAELLNLAVATEIEGVSFWDYVLA
jgi:hypothetical protein